MKVYVDLIFIVNFLVDLMVLIGLGKVLKYKISFIRLIWATLFGSFTTFILFINMNIILLNIIKFIISLMMVVICYGRKQLRVKLFYFYLISIVLGGFMYLININDYNELTIILLLIISPVVIYFFIKEQLSFKCSNSSIYNVCLFIDSKKYDLRGLLDTGNSLVDPYKKRSVILLNNDIRINKSRFIIIPYKALNYEGVVKCIKPDRVFVNNVEFKNCLVGFSNNELGLEVDCILPNKFKEEL